MSRQGTVIIYLQHERNIPSKILKNNKNLGLLGLKGLLGLRLRLQLEEDGRRFNFGHAANCLWPRPRAQRAKKKL